MIETKRRSAWPFIIIGVFVLLALFDANIVRLALSTKTGVTETAPYAAGLKYDEIIAAKQALKADGIVPTLTLKASAARVHYAGLPSERATLKLTLMRPDNPELDRVFSVTSYGPEFIMPLAPLKQGLWVVTADLTLGVKRYFFERREIIR